MKNQSYRHYRESGQTLIETIVAIFVLTVGLLGGLGLAVYAFGASSDIVERITATSLAREGIEVVRRMRDSNWLDDSLVDCGGGQPCYPDWLDEEYDIEADTYRVEFDPTATDDDPAKWELDEAPGSPSSTYYRLYLRPSSGFTHSNAGGAQLTNFFRKVVIIEQDTSAPYSAASPLILVRSTVWWHGRACPTITDLTSPSQTTCKIITEEYLTNWKNY